MSQNGGRPWRGRWRGRGQSSRGNYFSHYGNRGRGHSSRDLDGSQRNRKPHIVQHKLEVTSPYNGWNLYFPEEIYHDHSPTVERVQIFEKYFLSWSHAYNWTDIGEKGRFSIDFKELSTDQIITDGIPDLFNELKVMPERILSCIGLAMHQIVSQHQQRDGADDAEFAATSTDYIVPVIYPRLINFASPVPLKNLKANYYGKFICVKGTVIRVSNIKPLCTAMAFECSSCGGLQSVKLPDGKYVIPTLCAEQACKGKSFIPKRNSNMTETIDWQNIRVQEIMGDDLKESGRIPRTVDCELTNDLVDNCMPGDIVTVSGIVKVNSVEEGRGRNKDKCMFLLYLQANSVSNAKGNKSSNDSGSGMAVDFTTKELCAIEEIKSEEFVFRLLVNSLCPTIYGHELVKAGLTLSLFGGSQKFANDKNRIPVRGDPHMLVVGDPGLGKSQMLQSTANIAPRSVYVCGNTTTTSGLTVTLSKEGGSGDYALEAGALVLADQGCCCIDEFDKMGNQHQALLEAMEQQSISIAKAGIVCSLPARTSIIAAANPVGGHYNKAKTVAENLKMGSALLSRFDLVFILLDKPDEEMDSMLSEHVMALHGGRNRVLSGVRVRREDSKLTDSESAWEAARPLSERLKVSKGEKLDPIPIQLFRKYVAYARKYVHPKIGEDAAQVLQNFYLDLRKRHQTKDSTPITTRQLESLIRLTEARARLEMREVATKEDAENVVEIMKYSMMDTYSDQFGWLDFQRSQHGSGMSGRSQPKKFISALQKISDQTYNSIFTIQQMKQIAKDIGLQIMDFEGFVSSLNNQGFILKKGSKVFQLQTAGY